MTRHHLSKRLSAVAALALWLAAPVVGSAQEAGTSGGTGGSGGSSGSSGGVTARIVTVAGDSQDQQGDIWINLDHCQDNVDIEFEVDGLPGDKAVLDLWVSTGTNCSTAAARDGDREGDCAHLDGESVDIENRTDDVPVTLNVRDIVRGAFDTDDCGSSNSKPKLWFLAVDTEGGTDTATDYYALELNLDTDPPEAPTSIKGGRGENEIPVSWSVGNNSVDSFEIYVDSGGGGIIADASTEPSPSEEDGGTEPQPDGESNTMCGSGALRAGDSADNVTSLLRKSEGSATATSTTISRSLIEGDAAAVAVVALDVAGNRSPLSEVECLFVVPTTGFKDLYEQENGEIPQGCPCAAAGPAQLEGALPIALALGLIAYRRRRRS